MLSTYKKETEKIKKLIADYQKKRKELLNSEMYAEDFKQKKLLELRVKTFDQVAEVLDTMRGNSKKDLAAAYKKATPANLEEARYWATVVHQDLSSMNPAQIIEAYKAVIKEGLPIKKAEFERVARNILSSKEEYHTRLHEFEILQKEAMTPEEKERAKALKAAESLEGAINRIQDFTSYSVKRLEEGDDVIDTGRLDYLDVPFSEIEIGLAKEFDGKTESLSEHRANILARNQENWETFFKQGREAQEKQEN